MTAEHLMDAVGLLDDDLIQEAEQVMHPRRRIYTERWLGMAASLALVIALGYGAFRLGLVSGMKGGAGMSGAPSAEAPAGSAADSGAGTPDLDAEGGETLQTPPSFSISGGSDQAVPSEPEEQAPVSEPVLDGFIQLEQGTGLYLLTDLTADLPAGAISLGTLSAQSPDAPYPVTSAEEYAGLELWAEGAEPYAILYVQLPDGRYAAAELVEP